MRAFLWCYGVGVGFDFVQLKAADTAMKIKATPFTVSQDEVL